MSTNYAKQRFWEAIHSLATFDGTIQRRLASAAKCLLTLQPADLPDKLRQEFDGVQEELSKQEATGSEGTIVATTRQLTSEQGSKLANRILNIYMELHGEI